MHTKAITPPIDQNVLFESILKYRNNHELKNMIFAFTDTVMEMPHVMSCEIANWHATGIKA